MGTIINNDRGTLRGFGIGNACYPRFILRTVMPSTSHITSCNKVENKILPAHEELEQRIKQRTAELNEANGTTKQEIAQSMQYQEQIQLYNSVLMNTIEGTMGTDADGIIQLVNSSFSLITSYSATEVIGQNTRILKSDRHYKDDIVLTTTIISMAESLGLTTVAEGVETLEQYTLLRELGCTEVQGFYFSPPMVPETLTTFLHEHKKVGFNEGRPRLN